MAQTGFTPIKIYSSPTTAHVPLNTDLAAGELAINTFDGKLFYKDSSNVVQVIATKSGATGTVSSVSALTLGTTGTDLSSTVANATTTPVITLNVPTASATNRGALSSADWSLFNGKGNGTVTSVTGTAPIVSSGGNTPAISIAAASTSVNGYLTSTDWTTFNNKSNTNGTVTSVAAITLGTTGTDLSSTVATGTTTPVITLQVPTASATNRGALSSTDWNTFNGKLTSGGALGTPSSGNLANCTFPTLNQNTTGTADNAKAITNAGGWSITPSGTKLYFSYNSVNVGSLDSSGNLLVLGNVTAFAASV